MKNDPVEEVIQAYLDHLEEGAPEPSLERLTPEDRASALDLINSLNAGRGIDPFHSRPSLHTLLAGTDLEGALATPTPDGLSIDAIRGDVVSSLGSAAEPTADGAAATEGILSHAVVRSHTLRIRIQFRDDLASVAALGQVDPRAAAGPIFGRFPETAAVVVVIGDAERSSVAIGPYDTEEFIGAPDGEIHPPRITRPVLPLHDTLRKVVDDLAPDLTIEDVNDDHDPVDLADIIEAECAKARSAVVTEGRKARTDAKRETWPEFDHEALLAAMCHASATGDLTEAELNKRITDAVAAA